MNENRAAVGLEAPPLTVQVLFGLKSADPTALTAADAIRTLLGLGDRLIGLERRILHEFVFFGDAFPEAGSAAPAARAGRERSADRGAAALLEAFRLYLDRTVVLWNPNKQRGWVRLAGGARVGRAEEDFARMAAGSEVLPDGPLRPGGFGQPALGDPAYDHLLIWSRGAGSVPPDLPESFPGVRLLACGRAELYTFRWTESAGPEDRQAWTEGVAVARSRRQGLLVNPHYQDHRLVSGPVPLPLWGG